MDNTTQNLLSLVRYALHILGSGTIVDKMGMISQVQMMVEQDKNHRPHCASESPAQDVDAVNSEVLELEEKLDTSIECLKQLDWNIPDSDFSKETFDSMKFICETYFSQVSMSLIAELKGLQKLLSASYSMLKRDQSIEDLYDPQLMLLSEYTPKLTVEEVYYGLKMLRVSEEDLRFVLSANKECFASLISSFKANDLSGFLCAIQADYAVSIVLNFIKISGGYIDFIGLLSSMGEHEPIEILTNQICPSTKSLVYIQEQGRIIDELDWDNSDDRVRMMEYLVNMVESANSFIIDICTLAKIFYRQYDLGIIKTEKVNAFIQRWLAIGDLNLNGAENNVFDQVRMDDALFILNLEEWILLSNIQEYMKTAKDIKKSNYDMLLSHFGDFLNECFKFESSRKIEFINNYSQHLATFISKTTTGTGLYAIAMLLFPIKPKPGRKTVGADLGNQPRLKKEISWKANLPAPRNHQEVVALLIKHFSHLEKYASIDIKSVQPARLIEQLVKEVNRGRNWIKDFIGNYWSPEMAKVFYEKLSPHKGL